MYHKNRRGLYSRFLSSVSANSQSHLILIRYACAQTEDKYMFFDQGGHDAQEIPPIDDGLFFLIHT